MSPLDPLRGLLLVGPFVLVLFGGGFDPVPRLVAAVVAWVLLIATAILAPRGPDRRTTILAVGGLAGLTAWTAISLLWAPGAGPALADLQRLLLYLAALGAAAVLLRAPGWARATEPAVVAGCLVAVGYGLSERFLPGLIQLARSRSSFGRLENPMGYWNAMGALAAIGTILAVRLMGDRERPVAMRAAGAAAAIPLGLAVSLTFSRGALAALVVGLVALVLFAMDRAQVRAILVAVVAAAPTIVLANFFSGMTSLTGLAGAREREGAITLAVLVVSMVAAALATRRVAARELASGVPAPLPRRARRVLVGALVALVVGGGALAALSSERSAQSREHTGASAARLASVDSDRYLYWKVAARGFASHPLIGGGSSSFRYDWLRHRPYLLRSLNAHSLYLETADELGLVGVALLLVAFAGVIGAARRALRRRRAALAVGPAAALLAWALHAGVDWLWQLPALGLVVMLLAGLTVALAAAPEEAGPPDGAVTVSERDERPGSTRAPLLPRAAVALGGLLVIAFLAVSLRAQTLYDRAQAVLAPSAGQPAVRSSARRDAAQRDLREAAKLTLSRDPDFVEGVGYLTQGDAKRAAQIGRELTRAEPDNPLGWQLLSGATTELDPAESREAAQRLRILIPPVPLRTSSSP